MKQNTFWLIIGIFIVIFIEGFFVLHAGNKKPGILVMLSSFVGLILSFSSSSK